MTSVRPTERSQRQKSRLGALDALRMLAALAVLAYHYTAINQTFWGNTAAEEFPTLSQVTKYGYLGVELFFIVSGFVILMTAYGRTLPAFTASRLSRLYPAYWAAVLATILLQVFWHGGRDVDLVDGLINLTMLQEAWDVTSVQGAFWTLYVELKFYLLIGMLLAVGLTRRRVIAFAFLWPLLSQLARATDSGLLTSLLIPSYAPYFAGGMLLYLVYREGWHLILALGIGLNLVLCIRQAVRYADRSAPLHTDAAFNPGVVALLVILMFAAVLACAAGPLSRINWSWLTLAGALTYPLYLVHGQFGFFVINTLEGRVNSYLVLVLAATLALTLAWFIHRWVERPWHERMRNAVLSGIERP
ncbi:MAG: acyltransferase [Ornithinimicrobium sp.]|uniref:acyltransferase family protein n=1 Tax=Ornithinimicrobium sp. TaxID=1977084 RepID=UPI0026E0D2F8|nr:acyltransferase [Ornithinimicrobium sp.]MDO5741281.1 acyltransferase [Ornithinimicrobium sp.]